MAHGRTGDRKSRGIHQVSAHHVCAVSRKYVSHACGGGLGTGEVVLEGIGRGVEEDERAGLEACDDWVEMGGGGILMTVG